MSAEQPNPEPGGPCPKCDGEGGRFAEECPSLTTEWIQCKECDGSGEYWPEEEEPRGGLEGSWDFDVTHEGVVYKCRVDDADITIEAPSGMTMDAEWTGKGLDNWGGHEGDIPDETIPDAVLEEAEEQMRAMAESVSP